MLFRREGVQIGVRKFEHEEHEGKEAVGEVRVYIFVSASFPPGRPLCPLRSSCSRHSVICQDYQNTRENLDFCVPVAFEAPRHNGSGYRLGLVAAPIEARCLGEIPPGGHAPDEAVLENVQVSARRVVLGGGYQPILRYAHFTRLLCRPRRHH